MWLSSKVSLFPYVIRGHLPYFQILDSLCSSCCIIILYAGKLKSEDKVRSLLLKWISQLLPLAVWLVLWSGLTVRILGFFQMKWNWRCTSGAQWANPTVNGNSVHESYSQVNSWHTRSVTGESSIAIISVKWSHSTDLLLLHRMTCQYRHSERWINEWCIQLPLIFMLFNKKIIFQLLSLWVPV